MNLQPGLKSYLEYNKGYMNTEFLNNSDTTEELFAMVYSFLCVDFDELSDNRVYRCFLTSFKEIICFAFEQDVSKKYLRLFFKIINNEIIIKHITNHAKTRTKDIKDVMNRFVDFFTTSWQGYGNDKGKMLDNIVNSIEYWTKL